MYVAMKSEKDNLNPSPTKVSLKNRKIRLIKVPKFVATQWLNAADKDIVGILGFENEEISNLYVRKDENDNVKKLNCDKNETINTCILKQSKITLKKNKSSGNSVSATGSNVNNKYNERGNKNKSKMNMKTLGNQKSENETEEESFILADLVKNCEHTYTFLPHMDRDYSSILKERHVKTNIKKSRFTIIEQRNEELLDANNTLFKYYTNPSNEINNSSLGIRLNNREKHMKNNKRMIQLVDNSNNVNNNSRTTNINNQQMQAMNTSHTTTNKPKTKQAKKSYAFDIDKAKLNMFKIFEKEGNNGVPFSVFAKAFNIPPTQVKNILEEIAIKRKVNTDKKAVYFLKT